MIVLSLSAFKALSVYKAFEIDNGLVAVFYSTVFNCKQSCVLLLNLL